MHKLLLTPSGIAWTRWALIQATGLAFAGCFSSALAQASPAGLWNTISDDDGRPTAVVELREVNGAYVGVVRALLVPADHDDSLCTKCSGERRNQRVVGMQILWNMRPDGDGWGGGEILDPENGKTYRAQMKLTDGGRKLVLRGYIGVPLFGRSQTWIRRTEPLPP
jgi:uncharacterized protein (DUF2147 family)